MDELDMHQGKNLNDVIEYSDSIPDGSIDGSVGETSHLAAIVLTEGSVQIRLDTDQQPLNVGCNVEDHTRLMADLLNERSKVELLARELIEKDRIIKEQYELLKQLGVQLVTFTEIQQ